MKLKNANLEMFDFQVKMSKWDLLNDPPHMLMDGEAF